MKESNEIELIKKLKKTKIQTKEIIDFLKSNSVNFDLLDSNGYNCLHYAIRTENADIVSILLFPEANSLITLAADPNIATKDSKKDIYLHPLHYALIEVNDDNYCNKIIKMLIKAGGDVSSKDEFGCNIIHRVAEKGNHTIIDYCAQQEKIKDINEVSQYGSAIHMAIIGDKLEMVEYLLENFTINLLALDSHKNTPLLLAIVVNNSNIFKLIFDYIQEKSKLSIEEKKDIFNRVNDDGNSVLHELVYIKSTILLKLVLKLPEDFRTDVNIKNSQGHTYEDLQKNIVAMIAEKERLEKQKREFLRKEKEAIIQKKKNQEVLLKKAKQEEDVRKQKSQEFGMTLLKYRGFILAGVVFLFMGLLLFALTQATKKKASIVI